MDQPNITKREVVERILRVWEAHPEMRLGTLLHRATHGVPIDYLFDDELTKLIELYLPPKTSRKHSGKHSGKNA